MTIGAGSKPALARLAFFKAGLEPAPTEIRTKACSST